MTRMALFGDPHGNFEPVRRAARSGDISHAFFVGDFDLERPLEAELADLMGNGCCVHFVHGNHDADQAHWYDFVFKSDLATNNITARVIDVCGVRVAGLGGVFHPEVWHPLDGDGNPKFISRQDFLAANSRRLWRDGLPLRHRSTIFPEDFNQLAALEADILITHEAPSSHRYGHGEIDDLAEIMGVKIIVHGHLHQDYRATLATGIKVIGLGKAAVLIGDIAELLS